MKLLDFPLIRQTFDYDCGAAVTQSLLNYYDIDIREDILIKECGTTELGTSPSGIIFALEKHGLKCKPGKYRIQDLKDSIDREVPVILALQAWPPEPIENWEQEWNNGHYAVAIGYDETQIFFADPACINIDFLKFEDLKKRWHDIDDNGKKYINYGIKVFGRDARYKHDVYKEMK